jgi:hypothetical protein
MHVRVSSTTIAAVTFLAMAQSAAAQDFPIPNGIDNPMPRYYDYRAPRAFYGDDAPIAFDWQPGAPVYGYRAPPPAYGSQSYGYRAYDGPSLRAEVMPGPAPRPICGVYRYWRDGRCIDARGY